MLTYESKTVAIRPSVAGDVDYLAIRLRDCDVNEIWASNRQTPEAALKEGLECSAPCWTLTNKGNPVAMFGCGPNASAPDMYGCIWLLASDELEAVKTTFLKQSRRFIAEMLKTYPVLFNLVDNRNRVSIEWLKWCGAAMALPAPHGPDARLFRYFEFRRKNHV